MITETYKKGVEDIYTEYNCSLVSTRLPKEARFNLVSANLYKFLPELPFDSHLNILKEIILHNRLSHFEQSYPEILNISSLEDDYGDIVRLMKERACILSAFHFGSYRLFSSFLVEKEISFSIICPASLLEREQNIFKETCINFKGEFNESNYKFIELESPILGIQILRELNSGRNVFIYFDGARGIGNIREEGVIRFLGQDIHARQGVAFLSKAANAPLITALSYRTGKEHLHLKIFDPIDPKDSEFALMNKKEFGQYATQLSYDRLSEYVRKFPGQWEAWLYLHRQIIVPENEENKDFVQSNLSNEVNKKKLYFNHKDYGFFKIDNNCFLFDRRYYLTYEVEEPFYKLMSELEDNNFKLDPNCISLFDANINHAKLYSPILIVA